VNEVGDENIDKKMINGFWNWFWNKIKWEKNSWLLATKYSTNHANLLVIVTSHGFLAITYPSIQETFQSMAHKSVLHIKLASKAS